ncbi:MAG: YecA family protein [Gemmatimonadota bacterium]|jgi:uncharacterized protein
MIPSRPPTPRDRAALAAFLEGPSCAADALSLGEAQGFLFAVACAPELVPPSEWLPEIFGEREPEFATTKEAERILGTLMGIYNEVVGSARGGKPHLPRDCRLRDDPVSNLDSDAPVAGWSRGFREGHMWLEELWDLPFPEDLDQELGGALLTLMFFGWGEGAGSAVEEIAPGRDLPDVAAVIQESFPVAMDSYARMGMLMEEALRDAGPAGGAPEGAS